MYNEKYRIENIKRSLFAVKARVYKKVADLAMEIYTSKEPLDYAHRTEGAYRQVAVGDSWGELFDCAWFHCTGRVPESAAGEKIVYVLDINGEGLIYDDTGCPLRGITNVNSGFDRAMGNPGKRIVPFTERAQGGETVDFWMDAGCNDLVGSLQENGRIKEAYLATCDEVARELFYDGIVLFTQLENLPAEDPLRYELLDTLGRCQYLLRDYTREEYEACLELTHRQLAKTGGDGAGMSLLALGHAHIDLAWLWPLRETRRKGARTFATALALMERYGDYRFAASQPQLYQWVKEDHPRLYEKVKAAVEDGRWELQGALWVESDANLIGGESFVRQLLYGNAFWEKEFGRRVRYVWMPDTFGYSAALPQLMRKAGISAFSTIKMSWNLINRFPYTNFRWRGIDGSEVLVHMPPEGSYVSGATPKSITRAKKSLAMSGQFGESLMPYGIGDGGGGPSPCHLEYLKREKNLPGLCPIRQGSMQGFFDRLEQRADSFPVWQSEMYLERHLGVYTSAARSKKYNRRMELELRNTEMLAAVAHRLTGYTYPREALEALWKETLLYQFHDILPGSSIQRVYDESLARYAAMLQQTEDLRDSAARCLAAQVAVGEKSRPAVVFNTLSFDRTQLLETPKGLLPVTVPALGYTTVDLDTAAPIDEVYVSDRVLENSRLRATFGEDGSLTGLYSKVLERELLEGPSNLLLLYEDYDNAWNLQYDYQNQRPRRVTPVDTAWELADGVGKLRQRYCFGQSELELTAILRPDQPYLELAVEADWHERDTMLRIAFDPALHPERVDCEVQFGYVSRSALDNTVQEQAQIEMAAHRWIAVSEPGTHFALLNDCKYGYSLREGTIELNALRGTSYPGKDLDQGSHSFRYALYADGESDLTGVIREAHAFNSPLLVYPVEAGGQGSWPATDRFLQMDAPHVLVDGVKLAEKGDGMVVRTYEAAGRGGQGTLDAGRLGDGLEVTDLMERGGEAHTGAYAYRPFDVVTYLIKEK